MRNLMKSTVAAATILLAMAGTASASLLIESWDESNPARLVSGSIPGGTKKNDVLSALGLSTLGGYYGSQIRLTSDAKVTYTFVGFEAGFANRFLTGTGVFDTEIYAPNNKVINVANGLASFTENASAGLLDFRFLVNGGKKGIVNGTENINNVGLGGVRNPDFFATMVGAPTATSGNSIWLFLDDLGAGPDDDHDDLVVRIDVEGGTGPTPVPLPAGFALMGTALASFGFLRRRKA